MNPQTPNQGQDQQFTPQTESTPEADAAALQAIDALEAESEVTPTVEAPVFTQPAQPVSNPVYPSAEPAQHTVAAETPVAPSTPVETAAIQPAQAPSVAAPFPAQKAPSKKTPLIIAAVVAVVIIGAAVGYFVWQSMGS